MLTKEEKLKVWVGLFELIGVPKNITQEIYKITDNVIVETLENEGIHSLSYVRSESEHTLFIDAKRIIHGIVDKNFETRKKQLFKDKTVFYAIQNENDVPQIKKCKSWDIGLEDNDIRILHEFRQYLVDDVLENSSTIH